MGQAYLIKHFPTPSHVTKVQHLIMWNIILKYTIWKKHNKFQNSYSVITIFLSENIGIILCKHI